MMKTIFASTVLCGSLLLAGCTITGSNSAGTGLTLSDVATHATADDCWMVIDQQVYDVTSYIEEHPGGKSMLKGCGLDATEFYNNVEHSEEATALLVQYKLGALAQ